MFRGLALILLIGLAAAATAGSSGSEAISFSIPDDGWFAARFNLSGPSDLDLKIRIANCQYGDPRGAQATFQLLDGELVDRSFAPRLRWITNQSHTHLQAGPARTDGPVVQAEGTGGHCTTWMNLPWIRDTSTTLTVVGVSGGSHATGYIFANWTSGVDSWDLVTGQATIKNADEFERGVGFAVYPEPVTVGIGQGETFYTERDTLGWFAPHTLSGAIYSDWTCTRNGAACGDLDWTHTVPLISSGATIWDFETTRIEADAPAMTLGLVELPDDSYLT